MVKQIKEPLKNYTFSGKWISIAQNAKITENKGIYAFQTFKTFDLTQLPEKAFLRISADTFYRVKINNVDVGRGPIRGTITQHYFDTYNITNLLKTENIIAVEVLYDNYPRFDCASNALALIAEIPEINLFTDETWLIARDNRLINSGGLFCKQCGHMEVWDYRLELNYQQAQIAQIGRLAQKKLLPRAIPAMVLKPTVPLSMIIAEEIAGTTSLNVKEIFEQINVEPHYPLSENKILNPAALSTLNGIFTINPDENERGVCLIFDFGMSQCGFFEAQINAPAGTIIDVTYSEKIGVKGRLCTIYDSPTYHFTERYILADGLNKIGEALQERGGSMVQLCIRNFSSSVEIHSLAMNYSQYPWVKRGSFFSSDFLLNRIFDMSVNTLIACSTDAILDCPWRERSFWVNDFIIQNKSSLALFGAGDMHRHCFDLLFSQQRSDGLIPGVCPAPLGELTNEPALVLYPTNFFVIIMLHDYLKASGERDFVRQYLPCIEKIFMAFEKMKNQDHLIELEQNSEVWDFYDWSFELNGFVVSGCESLINILYCYGINEFLQLSQSCDYQINQDEYRKKYNLTASKIVDKFFDNQTMRFVDKVKILSSEEEIYEKRSTQLGHAFALGGGIMSEKYKKACMEALNDSDCVMPDLYLHRFIFEEMTKNGMLKHAIERIRKHWGNAANTGLPTIYEIGITKVGLPNGSLCHAFATSPISFFHEEILGVKPLQAGFVEFVIAPQIIDLSFAKGRIPTPYGEIEVHWIKKEHILEINFNVPLNTTAYLGKNKYTHGKYQITLELGACNEQYK